LSGDKSKEGFDGQQLIMKTICLYTIKAQSLDTQRFSDRHTSNCFLYQTGIGESNLPMDTIYRLDNGNSMINVRW